MRGQLNAVEGQASVLLGWAGLEHEWGQRVTS